MDPVAPESALTAASASEDPWESTPFTSPPMPDSTPISPAFPLITVGWKRISISDTSVRYCVAPAPTGSRRNGILPAATDAATSMEWTVLSFRVPMFRTEAEAMETMSATSSPSVMTGDPPAQMQMLAQSLTVT